MGKLLSRRGRGVSGAVPVANGARQTPSHADFAAWHQAIYNGRGRAAGMSRPMLLDALHGLNCMVTRDPWRLLALRDADDVCELVVYGRARHAERLAK